MEPESFENVYLRTLFYGDSGSGKTRLLGTAMLCEDTCPMLILNARGQPISLRFLKDRPLVMTIRKMEDFNSAFAWITNNQPLPKLLSSYYDVDDSVWTVEGTNIANTVNELPNPFNYIYEYLIQRGDSRFKTLGIDSITQVQRIANDIVVENVDTYVPNTIPNKRTYPHYQKLLDMLMKFADEHYMLPCHVLMTALCRHSEMPGDDITRYYPFLLGQGAHEVPSYAELVGRLVNVRSLTTQITKAVTDNFVPTYRGEQPFNVLYTQGSRNFVAKWQGPEGPPAVVINPTIKKLLDVIKAG